jgi:hypothetical protein
MKLFNFILLLGLLFIPISNLSVLAAPHSLGLGLTEKESLEANQCLHKIDDYISEKVSLEKFHIPKYQTLKERFEKNKKIDQELNRIMIKYILNKKTITQQLKDLNYMQNIQAPQIGVQYSNKEFAYDAANIVQNEVISEDKIFKLLKDRYLESAKLVNQEAGRKSKNKKDCAKKIIQMFDDVIPGQYLLNEKYSLLFKNAKAQVLLQNNQQKEINYSSIAPISSSTQSTKNLPFSSFPSSSSNISGTSGNSGSKGSHAKSAKK